MGTNSYEAGIEHLKSGELDRALVSFKITTSSFADMDQQMVGNCQVALALLYGAAGEKAKALEYVAAAKGTCSTNNVIGKFLSGLKKHLEQPQEASVPSPFMIKGKKVDLFYYTGIQVLITGAATGDVSREQIVDSAIDGIAAGLLRQTRDAPKPKRKKWWQIWK